MGNDGLNELDVLGLDYLVFVPDCKKCDPKKDDKNHKDPSGKVSPGKFVRCGDDGAEKERWEANSGRYKTEDSKVEGPDTRIQPGDYKVGGRGEIGQANGRRGGQKYFHPLAPTPGNKTPQTGLGIHPDGGYPGTHGCIGCDEDGDKLKGLDDFLTKAKRPLRLTALPDAKCDSKSPCQEAKK